MLAARLPRKVPLSGQLQPSCWTGPRTSSFPGARTSPPSRWRTRYVPSRRRRDGAGMNALPITRPMFWTAPRCLPWFW